MIYFHSLQAVNRTYLFFILGWLSQLNSLGQSNPVADSLFKQARQTAFDRRDYPAALDLCWQVLAISPNYPEVQPFMGRLHTWSGQLPEARLVFSQVLGKDSVNYDALSAAADLEHCHGNPCLALTYCRTARRHYPSDGDLQLKEAHILTTIGQAAEAYAVANRLLHDQPANPEARSLVEQLRETISKRMISVGYDYLHFDRRYNNALHTNPWQLGSVAYTRFGQWGSLTGRINHASRFGRSGGQAELEASPNLGTVFHAYTLVSLAGSESLFPRFRTGASLFARLPAKLEAEVGFRYLLFDRDIWLYTLAVSKYTGKFWFNLRTYLVPGTGAVAPTYLGTVRYYYHTADDFVGLVAGTGISPDESRGALLGQDVRRVGSQQVSLEIRRRFRHQWIPAIVISWLGEDQPNRLRGNQLGVSAVLRHRF